MELLWLLGGDAGNIITSTMIKASKKKAPLKKKSPKKQFTASLSPASCLLLSTVRRKLYAVNSQVPLPVLAEYALPVGLCQMPGPSMGLAAAPPCLYISTTSEGLVSTTVWGLRPRSAGLMRALCSSFSTTVCLAARPTVLACGQTDLCQQFLGLLATGQVDNIYLQIKPSSHNGSFPPFSSFHS